MKLSVCFTFFGVFLAGALSAAATAVVPNKFIIEVDPSDKFSRRRGFDHPLDAVYHDLKSRAIDVKVSREFKSDGIFSGAVIIIEDARDFAIIQNTPGIIAIRPIQIFLPPNPSKHYILTGPQDSNIPPDTLSTHILGGVDKVHAEGNIGTGVNIGIIDTGVDYNHPILGSNGIGPGKKIFAGYDFVGDDYKTEDSPLKPDPDPMDCAGHGTHVAGIISAIPGNPYNISGVAYGANIGAYKIFGCSGGTTDEIIVDALLRAVKDGMDVITLSLGGPDGWSASSAAVVADRVNRQGKVVTIAAGNEGASGAWYASSPASGEGVIAVGSVDNTVIPLQNATISGVDHPPVTYYSALPFPVKGALPIFATSTNTSVADDACSPLPASTPDLSKFLVVIRRGGCNFATKLTHIADKGAKVAFIYDNGRGVSAMETGGFKLAAMVQAADGEFLVQHVGSAKVTFPEVGGATNWPDPHGGLMSDFSSYGPTFDFKFKPSISAPGGNIMSTFPVANGSYAVFAALLLAAKGKGIARSARTLFETTSNMIPATKDDSEAFDTISKAGAGLINVYKAIHSKTIVSPGELILNDTAHFQGIHFVDVYNADSITKTYMLKHVPALTALTMKDKSIQPSLGPVPLISAPAAVNIFPSTFVLPPGHTQKFVVSITPPTGGDVSRFPVYSGFIEITSDSESHHVTYLGLAAKLKDHQILDNTTDVLPIQPPALLDPNGEKLNQPTNFTFKGVDHPQLLYRLVMGTPSLRVDLVDPNTDLKPTFDKRQLSLFGITFPPKLPGGSFSDVKVIGSVFSKEYLTRNDENMDSSDNTAYYTMDFSNPLFSNGTKIPNGQYRFLMRALKITGNPAVEEDYESWLSPIIGIMT